MNEGEASGTPLFLLEEDYIAADRLLQLSPEIPVEFHGQMREIFARNRARIGQRMFEVRFGLREPANSAERIYKALFHRSISGDVAKQELEKLANAPLDAETVQSLYDWLAEGLTYLSRALQDIAEAAVDVRKQDLWTKYEPRIERLLKEMRVGTAVPQKYLERTCQWIEEVRLQNQLPELSFGYTSAATALQLVMATTRIMTECWSSINQISKDSLEGVYPFKANPCELFYESDYAKFSPPQTLMTWLSREAALARLEFRKNAKSPAPDPSAIVNVNNHIHVDSMRAVPRKAKGNVVRATRNSAVPPGEKRSSKIYLRNWGLAAETSTNWWLFHKRGDKWLESKACKIPKGNPSRILWKLMHQFGSLSSTQATDLFAPDYPGKSLQDLKRIVTDGLAKAKSRICAAIAECCQCHPTDIPNPIPFVAPGWMAKIELGIVENDDSGRRRFRIRNGQAED